MKKKVILIILFSFLSFGNLYAQWFSQPAGTNTTFKEIYFINENTGWICGFGRVVKTTDGGNNWTSYLLPNKYFNSICFTDINTGWVCGDSGKVYKTTDAGTSWNFLNVGTTSNLMRIRFIGQSTGIVVGNNMTILKTSDAGQSWNSIMPIDSNVHMYGCKILNNNTYFVTGMGSHIFKTINGGITWDTMSFNMVNPLWAPEFINDNTGWVTGCCGMYVKTTNGGANWSNEVFLTLGYTLYTLQFINSATGYVSGDGGRVFRTTNTGSFWDSTYTGSDEILYSVFMVNANTGWTAGNYGTILKTTNGGGAGFTIGVEQISGEVPKAFSLSQNYPNPFNPSTQIEFNVAENNFFVKLIVYDASGKEIKRLVNRELNSGTYRIDFNAGDYASGIYYYRLETASFTETRKMVLVK